MKPLNSEQISKTYWHFVGRFLILISTIVLIIFCFLKTMSQQIQKLTADKERYDAILFTHQQLADKTDTLYKYLGLFNTKLIRNDRSLQQLIGSQKDEIATLMAEQSITDKQSTADKQYAVYQKLVSYVNEMLLLKDSIRIVDLEVSTVNKELQLCKQRERFGY